MHESDGLSPASAAAEDNDDACSLASGRSASIESDSQAGDSDAGELLDDELEEEAEMEDVLRDLRGSSRRSPEEVEVTAAACSLDGRLQHGGSSSSRSGGDLAAPFPAATTDVAGLLAASGGDAVPDEPPEKKGKKKKKKPLDPVKAAQKRLMQAAKKARKEAKKARKRERKLSEKKRGAAQDCGAFLQRTLERIQAEAKAAEAMAALAMAQETAERRGNSTDLEAFLAKTRGRLMDRATLEAAATAAAEQAKQAAAAANAETNVERMEALKALARQAHLREVEHLRSIENLFKRRRIVIVGAGPVGLWAALLLAQKYRGNECCHSLARRPDAPEIVVLEARPEEKHATRKAIRIMLSRGSTQILNAAVGSSGRFSSGMAVADIETAFLQRLRKVAPHVNIKFGQQVQSPAEVARLEHADCVIWAGGKRSLDAASRRKLGCEMHGSGQEKVVVFQLHGLEVGADMHSDLNTAIQQRSKRRSFRVILRPGVAGVCDGWLWLIGAPQDLVAKQPPPTKDDGGAAEEELPASFVEAVEAVVDFQRSGESAECLRAAAEVLQERIRPAGCTARWVDAEFWHCDRSVCDLNLLQEDEPATAEAAGGGSADGEDGTANIATSAATSGKPLLVLGDSLCGKPFFTGATLNAHFKLVHHLIEEVDWTDDGHAFGCGRFCGHERRYQQEVQRVSSWRRALAGNVEKTGPPSPAAVVPAAPPAAGSPASPQATAAALASVAYPAAVATVQRGLPPRLPSFSKKAITLKAPLPTLSKTPSLPRLPVGARAF
eukprot:TRINITY_DN12723_c0_g1_i2.p1 TRINITY_DN12723_c0_g1~~TRINITY_DN12723_c0_g1_i2.p1  ORF type:complete len:780 (+),score=243.33 TRINITY_DN12723_c0_g1_i2:103-2442(+)